MLSVSNEGERKQGSHEKLEQVQDKLVGVKAMTFHFELNPSSHPSSSRRSSTSTTGPIYNLINPTITNPNTTNIDTVDDQGQMDENDSTQRRLQQRYASARYYVKNKETIKEKRRMRYWVGILAKIARRSNANDDKSMNEDGEIGQNNVINEGKQVEKKKFKHREMRSKPKETVFVLESGQPRQKGRQIRDIITPSIPINEHPQKHPNTESVQPPIHHTQQLPTQLINSPAVHFHEQLNAIIGDTRVQRREDLVVTLKPVLEAMLTKIIELEQHQQQQQTF